MTAVRGARCLAQSTRPLSTSQPVRASDAHENQYDPPTGWLWGIPPGQKYQKEGCENLMFYGFFGSFVVGAIALAFKPDTS
jgi:hypothetical protein